MKRKLIPVLLLAGGSLFAQDRHGYADRNYGRHDSHIDYRYDRGYSYRQPHADRYYGGDYRYHSERSAGKSVAIVGGSAAAGAIVGALAGGGQGAAIGAAVGGIGGLIFDQATRNSHHH